MDIYLVTINKTDPHQKEALVKAMESVLLHSIWAIQGPGTIEIALAVYDAQRPRVPLFLELHPGINETAVVKIAKRIYATAHFGETPALSDTSIIVIVPDQFLMELLQESLVALVGKSAFPNYFLENPHLAVHTGAPVAG